MNKNDTFLIPDKPDIKIEPLTNCQLKRYTSGDGYKLHAMWKSLTNPNDSIHNDESFWNDIDLKRGLRAELTKGYKILLSILITLIICLIGLLIFLIIGDLVLKKYS
uniref:Unspecified product n=1 Tax=Strongyloides stercoralis TaxID=6248 RepID=A0A0K0ERI9_STRER